MVMAGTSKIETMRPRRSLVAGDHAPEFAVVDPTTRKTLRSAELLGERPLLLTFYRGAWCPCCKADLEDLRRAEPRLRELGLTVMGVFHGLTAAACTRIRDDHGVAFPLVDDAVGEVARDFGIRETDEEMRRARAELGAGFFEGQPWIEPMQARYLIGRDGVIVHAELFSDYGERVDPLSWLPALVA